MFVCAVYGLNMLEINTYGFTEEIFKLVENKYEILDKKMEGSGLVLIIWAI